MPPLVNSFGGFLGMKFKELTTEILSHKNGSITTKNGLYFSNIHFFVELISKRVNVIVNPARSEEAKLLKKQMQDLYDAIVNKNTRIKAINSRR